MKNLIIFNASDPLGTAMRVNSQDIITLHGPSDARDILDGAHLAYKALYADVFLGKLHALLEELEE